MNTLHFKYALEVAKTGSITQAAENLFMAQPNLSKAIKELEETLDYQIFERSAKGMFPTKKGAEFLVYARSVLMQIDKIKDLAHPDASNNQVFNISIPRGSYIAQGFTKFVAELDIDKGIDVNMEETNSVKTITNVAEGAFHLGVIRYQMVHEKYFTDYLRSKNLNSEDIWEFKHLAIMSKKHPLANAKQVKYTDLIKYVEIVHGDNTVPYLVNADTNGNKDINVKKKIYVYERYNQFDLLETITTSYMWTSPIPDNILARYGLVQRRCHPIERVYKDVLIYPKGYEFSELDNQFMEKVKEEKIKVSKKVYK
ncbi:DNA-binding transcriptional LysR family regulator [Breznakia sp. PF5-3]|uniref:LysR family transcriptional regulator n=1 Tax=unclassified Breznakia TaxID=2623764 RepID=UPI0024060B1A|nr:MULTISPECIES: LysR family transcriptional regulator [unclassified Breznakia]MDF9823994.1 DNA-binding transcriptional LysR family regulator [Breznakia sp. PM6-1]MDF9834793.1 DNA-binding transcriptional LysR family regulator [Breznakia sp. PF5-3]MDF9838060.1 DNA-binding transcriptional LysR family regulator [Breznakia sp. PFB2-8]MDF9860046.1 DNA-binding transcriptional LysR family regulator [Breznakia sp. PH5-24]